MPTITTRAAGTTLPTPTQMWRDNHRQGRGDGDVAGGKPKTAGGEDLAGLNVPDQCLGPSTFYDLLDNSGEQVHTDPGDGHSSRQTHTAHDECDYDQDRDREEDAVLHEGPDQVVERVRQRINCNEHLLFASSEPLSSHCGSGDK
ncbi:MAG: hypothetical protein ACR2MC_03680 [Actinomycetota bacterium]